MVFKYFLTFQHLIELTEKDVLTKRLRISRLDGFVDMSWNFVFVIFLIDVAVSRKLWVAFFHEKITLGYMKTAI